MDDDGAADGWLFLHPSAVPDEWSDRIRPVVLVALDENELASILRSGSVERAHSTEDEELLALISRGFSVRAIASQVGQSERTVHRRLARLRDHYGVSSTPELVAELSRRGF